MSQNEYWAFNFSEQYTDEIQLATIKDVLTNLGKYETITNEDQEVVAIVHEKVFNDVFDYLNFNQEYQHNTMNLENFAGFIANITDYSLVVFGEQDETTYALVASDLSNSVATALNS